MIIVASLKRNANSSINILNVLSLSYDGNFEKFLTDTGHNIYELDVQKIKEPYSHSPQVGLIKYIRDNDKLHLVPSSHLDIDIILCNGESQLGNAKQISQVMHCPFIYVDHIGNIPKAALTTANLCVSAVDEKAEHYIPYYQHDWQKLFTTAKGLIFKL